MPSSAEAATLARPANNLGLQAFWSFDEGTGTKANGLSGTLGAGTITGAAWASGKRGNALSFNGTSDKVAGGSMTVGTNMTISAWVKKTSSTSQRSFFSNRGAGGTVYFGLDGTQIFLYNDSATPAAFRSSVGSVQMAQWQHVVVTSNGSVSTFYINGVFATSTTQTRSSSTGATFGIGWDPNIATEYWGGSIDEVRVYNRVLTSAEVSALYSSGDVVQKIVPRSGLVGEWLFNEGTSTQARDTSGQGNNGTLVSSPLWVAGKHGKALQFNSTNWVTAGQPAALKITSSFTASAWVNTTYGAQGGFATRWYNVSGRRSYRFFMSGASLQLNLSSDGTANFSCVISAAINDGRWHHVVAVYDAAGTTVKLYKDSVLLTTCGSAPASLFNNNEPFQIGPTDSDTVSNDLTGALDDVRVYNRALSSSEIQALYKERATTVNSSRNAKMTNGLVGLWSFDGPDVTDKVYDRSGQGNNGYLIGAATSTAKTIGKLGQALRFNGTTSYVQVANSSSLNPTNLTVSTWAKSDTGTWSNHGFLVSKRSVYIIHPQQGSIGVSFYIFTSGWNAVSCTPTTDITKWNLYSFTWNGTNLTAYINGIQCGSTTPAGPINTTDTNPLYFGVDSGNRYLNGALDDVRIYNRALPASEIKQLYNMGK